jgi:hypothetical protein
MGEASWTDYTAEVSVKLSKELKNWLARKSAGNSIIPLPESVV